MADDTQTPVEERIGQVLVGAVGGAQLTQVRVPLDEAGKALSTADETTGRPPIVVVPEHALRIRNEYVIGGIVAIGVALLVDLQPLLRGALLVLGAFLVFYGVFRAFFASIPEGSQALSLRRGRYDRTLPGGTHFVRPGVVISHVVTTRETPFDVPAYDVPTRDNVRTNLHVLLTFRIERPELFVYRIAVPDFDNVCQAASQDAVRSLVRSKMSDDVLDLGADDEERLRADIAVPIAAYGIEIVRVVITHIRPPEDFAESRESARLAALRRAEEQEKHGLEMLRLADHDEQEREQIRLRRAAIELEADNEEARLGRLDARLREFPVAMHWDVDGRRLDVAEALATNTRAMVQVGPGHDIAASLLMPAGGEVGGQDSDAAMQALLDAEATESANVEIARRRNVAGQSSSGPDEIGERAGERTDRADHGGVAGSPVAGPGTGRAPTPGFRRPARAP